MTSIRLDAVPALGQAGRQPHRCTWDRRNPLGVNHSPSTKGARSTTKRGAVQGGGGSTSKRRSAQGPVCKSTYRLSWSVFESPHITCACSPARRRATASPTAYSSARTTACTTCAYTSPRATESPGLACGPTNSRFRNTNLASPPVLPWRTRKDVHVGGNVLVAVRQGNVGRYLKENWVLSKENSLALTFPHTIRRDFPTKTLNTCKYSVIHQRRTGTCHPPKLATAKLCVL